MMDDLVIRFDPTNGEIVETHYPTHLDEYELAEGELIVPSEKYDHRSLRDGRFHVDTSNDSPKLVKNRDSTSDQSLEQENVSSQTRRAYRNARSSRQVASEKYRNAEDTNDPTNSGSDDQRKIDAVNVRFSALQSQLNEQQVMLDALFEMFTGEKP